MHPSGDLSDALVVSSEPHSLVVLPLKHAPFSESSSSSSKVSVQDDKRSWLDAFLGETFCYPCEAHPLHWNEVNQYCINCNQSAGCRFCVPSGPHYHHQILQIHRYGFRDAVYLRDMKKFIDCSEIQSYKSKGQFVIPLNPFEHNGSPSSNDEASCNICSGKLTNPDKYRYCSISCKVKAVLEKPNDSVTPFILNPKPYETQEETSKPQSLRKRRRKGTPCRAPLF